MSNKWQVAKEVLSSKIDDEVVLMSIEVDSYFSLEPVASRIWELLSEKPLTTEELAIILMEEYDIEEAECLADVQLFLNDMLEKKLILPSD